MVTSIQFNGDSNVLATSSLDGSTMLCDVEVSPKYPNTRIIIVHMSIDKKKGTHHLNVLSHLINQLMVGTRGE